MERRLTDSATDPTNRMRYLSQKLAKITSSIPNGSEVALLDEPLHRNIGDHVIHLGTLRFFEEHQIALVARAHCHNYDRGWLRRKIGADTIIVCSGGGHLGDLYYHHQRLREQVIEDFPANRIVVLPQSVFFRSAERQRQAVEAFRRHRDFHLFLRDEGSLRKAMEMGLGNLHLAPDMAHGLYPIEPVSGGEGATGSVLYLMRRDTETAGAAVSVAEDGTVCDWANLMRPMDTARLAAIAGLGRVFRPVGSPEVLERALDRVRTDLVTRGIGLVSGCERVVSSRLHGALLGLLLGKPVCFLGNLTGKSKFYYDTWLSDFADCTYRA